MTPLEQYDFVVSLDARIVKVMNCSGLTRTTGIDENIRRELSSMARDIFSAIEEIEGPIAEEITIRDGI